jgi:uncharacterized protein (DUF302 family)
LPIGIIKQVDLDVQTALQKLKDALKENRWGVLGDIDVKAVLKEKLGVETEEYHILDVCNPRFADRGLKASKEAGLVLPCKMAVYADRGRTNVGLYLPTKQLPAELQGVPELKRLSEEAESSLKAVLASI